MHTRYALRMFIPPFLFLMIVLSLWELSVQIFDINKIILPPPSSIYKAIESDYVQLFYHTAITMFEAINGFLISLVGAYLLAIIFVASKYLQSAIYPYAIALKSTPIIAIAPIVVLWFGNGVESKIVISSLVAFFPILVNSITGLNAIPKEIEELMRSYSASFLQFLIKVRIPYSLQYLFPAMKIASSLSVVGAVIGEFVGSTEGIGYLINTSSYYLDTPLMFAGVFFISMAGILFFSLIDFIERKVLFWEGVRKQ